MKTDMDWIQILLLGGACIAGMVVGATVIRPQYDSWMAKKSEKEKSEDKDEPAKEPEKKAIT